MDNFSSLNSLDTLLRTEKLITGHSVSKRKKVVLHNDLSLTIGKGELIALLGPNGAGKSTLLGTVTGMLPPLGGDVYYGEKNLAHMSNKEVAKEVALVLTDKIDDRYLTTYELVATGRYPYGSFIGKLTELDKDNINNAIDAVGAGELITRFFYTLSDGEKQKVLLARALAQDTPLILLDEPTAFIDSPGKVVIMNLLTKLVKDHNKTILLTTHDTELALSYASRLWLLGKDNTFVEGLPDELVKNGMINKLFDRQGVVFNRLTYRFEAEK